MKKHRFYGGLFATPLLITTRYSYLTLKNTNNYSPSLEQANHAQAKLLATHTTLNEKDKKTSVAFSVFSGSGILIARTEKSLT